MEGGGGAASQEGSLKAGRAFGQIKIINWRGHKLMKWNRAVKGAPKWRSLILPLPCLPGRGPDSGSRGTSVQNRLYRGGGGHHRTMRTHVSVCMFVRKLFLNRWPDCVWSFYSFVKFIAAVNDQPWIIEILNRGSVDRCFFIIPPKSRSGRRNE